MCWIVNLVTFTWHTQKYSLIGCNDLRIFVYPQMQQFSDLLIGLWIKSNEEQYTTLKRNNKVDLVISDDKKERKCDKNR